MSYRSRKPIIILDSDSSESEHENDNSQSECECENVNNENIFDASVMIGAQSIPRTRRRKPVIVLDDSDDDDDDDDDESESDYSDSNLTDDENRNENGHGREGVRRRRRRRRRRPGRSRSRLSASTITSSVNDENDNENHEEVVDVDVDVDDEDDIGNLVAKLNLNDDDDDDDDDDISVVVHQEEIEIHDDDDDSNDESSTSLPLPLQVSSSTSPSSSPSSCYEYYTLSSPKFNIPQSLYDSLYDHQKVGVQWLTSLHAMDNIRGGILGDDMGLGKTYQTLTLLWGLIRTKTIYNALIVVPVSVMGNWEREAKTIMKDACCSGGSGGSGGGYGSGSGLNGWKDARERKVKILTVSSRIPKEKRARMLEDALLESRGQSHPHIVITCYGVVKTSKLDFLGGRKDDSLYWDYVILDEGHLIKNESTQQHKACERIARSVKTHRLLLTGTPLQNNMKELWTLLHWATSGKVFGNQKRFMNQYAIPMEEGREVNASEWTRRTAVKAERELRKKLKSCFLQRMKAGEFKDQLPDKEEFVVWIDLSIIQRKMYENYLMNGGGQILEAVLSGNISSPLEAITWLKKLCDHPSLELDKGGTSSQSSDKLINQSGKLKTLVYLVQRLQNTGHRCLIFSPSTKILDIIAKVLDMKLGRIDGSVKGKDRQAIVDAFNQDDSKFDALLISTKAGGVGLTLTGADRVILFSPSWNPADDNQAVDRIFRIGQRKNVQIYRFITAGTVEEYMYSKQVQKDGLKKFLAPTSINSTDRLFDKNDLSRLFELGPRRECKMLESMKQSSDVGVEATTHTSGICPILENHDTPGTVIGVSSHNIAKKGDVIDLVSRTSRNKSASRPAGTSNLPAVRKSNTKQDLARHKTTARKIRHDAIPLKSSTKYNEMRTSKQGRRMRVSKA